jgi:hypothetical protein
VTFRQALRSFFAGYEGRRVAEARGMELLLTHLSVTQRAQFNARGRFEVRGSDSSSRYVIRNMSSINIDQLGNNGECIQKWCFGPQGDLVQGDILLAQKFALECFENEALRRAHAYPPNNMQPAGRR